MSDAEVMQRILLSVADIHDRVIALQARLEDVADVVENIDIDEAILAAADD